MTLRRNKKMPVLAVTGFIALVGLFSVFTNVNEAHAEYGVGDYTLTPAIDAGSVSSSASAGQKINVKATITNSGQTKTKNNSSWVLTRTVVASGNPIAGGASNTEPCGTTSGYFKSGSRVTCEVVNAGEGTLPVAHQTWFLDGNTTTGYKIKLGGIWSTRCLDAGGTADGSPVTAYECNGTSHQQWDMRADGTIRDRRSGKCLDVDYANANNNGANIMIYKCEVAAKVNHRWVLNSSTNTLKLVNGAYTKMCLDGNRAQAEAGWTKITVQFWECANGKAFKSGITNIPTQTSFIGQYPMGTQVCFALSVRERSSSSSQWQHSASSCAMIGKMPKVQVWGNDIITGGRFAGFTLPATQKSVTASITEQAINSRVEPAPATAFSGLWKTGVSDSNNKLGANATDPHWIIDRVYNPVGAKTCQLIDTPGGMVQIPNSSSATSLAARTINEQGGRAGQYANDPTRIGEPFGPLNLFLWGRVDPGARWIGQNMYGRNYSTASCKDPTRDTGGKTDAQMMPGANIYVFKLKNGFTIDPSANVDLSSVNIYMEGAADNLVRFYVNGTGLGPWQEPKWEQSDPKASSGTPPPGIFKNGKNDLEIHVQSTFPMTGLLITKIEAQASRTSYDTEVFGSWGEYAIRPTGPVAGMASGAGLNGGRDTNTPSVWSNLTLAKSATGGCVATGYGCYVAPAQAKTMPDIESRFFTAGQAANLNTDSITMSTQPAGRSVYLRNGDLRITGGTLIAGRSVVIKATGNVTIENSVRYGTGPLTSISQIPQLIIIANNIYIKENVEQVDAWLVAKGTATSGGVLDTCDVNRGNYNYGLTVDTCNTLLTINGPVMAQHLWLRRTAGSGVGTAGGAPAEIINLRPDAYLWGTAQNTNTNQLQTTSTRELPPRF